MHLRQFRLRNFFYSRNTESTRRIIHCVQKKTCDHVFEDKLNWNCPFTTFFGTLITKSVGHRQMFSHLTYFTLGNCQDLNIIKKITRNHENFTGTCDSEYKSLSVNAVWCTKTVEWIGRQELETWKHRQSAEENPQDGFNCLVTRQRKTAFFRWTCQKGTYQPVRFRMKLSFSVKVCTG